MTGRTDPPTQGSSAARALLFAALGLALASTAVLVLSDSLRWMRLGVVAALWAALAGAFLAARYRRQVADRAEEAAQLQHVYELELEREVAARREHELEVEATTRRKVEEETSNDLDALREELKNLRQSLEVLLSGGEVFVERFALHAEATRMRGLEGGAIAARPANQVRHITAAGEPDTQLIGRVPRANWTGEEEPDRIDPDWTPSWESSRQAPIPAQNRVRPAQARSIAPGRQEAEAAQPRRADVSQEVARPAARPQQRPEPTRRTAANGTRPGPEASQEFSPVRRDANGTQRGPEASQELAPIRRDANGAARGAEANQGRRDASSAPRGQETARRDANGVGRGPEASQEFSAARRDASGVAWDAEASQEFAPVRRDAASRGPQVGQEFGPARRDANGAPWDAEASQEFGPDRRDATSRAPQGGQGARGPEASQEFSPVRRDAASRGPQASQVVRGPEASQEFGPVRRDSRGPQVSQEFPAVRRDSHGVGPQVSQELPAVRRDANGAAAQVSQEFRRDPAGAAPGSQVSQELAVARRAPAAAPDFSAVRPSPPDFRAPVAGPQASQEFAPVRRQAEQYPPARLSAPGPMSQPPAPGAQPPASVSQRPAPVAQSQASVSQSAARPPAANHPAPVAPAAQPAAARDLPPTHRPRSAERTEVAMQPAPEPGGRRRAVTGTFPPVTAESQPDSGGRRRRAEGAPTWQETIEPEDTGSHSSGKSVSELLAAHGAGNAPRRHRRRGEE